MVELAGWRAAEVVDGHDGPGLLIAGQAGGAPLPRFAVLERAAGGRLDHGHHDLAEALVGYADNDAVHHRRVGPEDVLHFFGEDLLAAGIDAARSPAEECDRAVGFDAGPVAGHGVPQPVDPPERAGRLLRILVVAERRAAADGQQP